MSIDKTLRTEIQEELEGLRDLELGTDKHKVAVDSVTKLMDKAIEMEKLDADADERIRSHEADEQFKREQLEAEKKDRFVKNVIAVGTTIVTTGLAVWGTITSLKFEETGTVTTLIGRTFIGKLIPKK